MGKRVALAADEDQILKLLELMDKEAQVCCIVTKEHGQDVRGIPVISYEELSEDMADVIIVSSFENRYEIREKLQKIPTAAVIIDLYEELDRNGLALNRDFL